MFQTRTPRITCVLGLLMLVGMAGSGLPAHAQPFDSGSDESDGALNITVAQHGSSFVFDPAVFVPPLDTDGDNIYHFTTISVEAGVTVRLAANVLGSRPVHWLASGAVQIDGVLDLSGEAGHHGTALHARSTAGAGGHGGGIGGAAGIGWRPGDGPGGGPGGGSAAGHVVVGDGSSPGTAYGTDFLLPLLGGSGGAGGSSGQPSEESGGGGAGGGALLIASSTSITIEGTMDMRGGCGGAHGAGSSSPGGAGSSGALRLMANTIGGAGVLTAAKVTGCIGNAGSRGRIRMEASQFNFTGTGVPAPTVVTPGSVFPPAATPSLRLVSVAGIPVPANATGFFPPADLTIDEAAQVTVVIEASNVPLFTTVQLTLTPETGSRQIVTSTPLNGMLDLSTATAQITIPHGFSTFFLEAAWTP